MLETAQQVPGRTPGLLGSPAPRRAGGRWLGLLLSRPAPQLAQLLALSPALGCAAAGLEAKAEPVEAECSVQLGRPGPRSVAEPTARPEQPSPASLAVVHVDAPLAPLRAELERRIEKRLADGSAGIGPAGVLRYRVERGAVTLSTSASKLLVETPIEAHVEACHGARCYASCQPRAVARAEVPLLLGPDYRFAPSKVTLRFVRGCKVRALGGFLTIDVTPTLEAQLAPELSKLSRQIDRQLPDVRNEAGRAWSELSTPRELPLGGCLLLQPLGLIQGPFTPSDERLLARFAARLTPELRADCGAVSEPPALPPLQTDPALPEEGVVRLGMVTPLASLERAFETTSTALGGKQARVTGARVVARGPDVDVALTLAGEVCGSVAFTAQPDFSAEGSHVGLSHPTLVPSERDRLTRASVEPSAAIASLSELPRMAPLLSVHGLRDAVPALASAQSEPSLAISAQVSSARPAGAAARGDELVAWLEARGRVSLKLETTTTR
jgi:hypothetical protein